MNNPFPRMHVSLYVSDISKSVEFYSQFFGQEPTKVKPNYAKYVLESPSLIISFVENKERVHSNFGHLGFQVETLEDLNIRLWQAKKNNLVAREEVGTNCCYAKQDKFWVNDPDNVQWEVYYFHEDAAFNDPHYELSGATSRTHLKNNESEQMSEASACCSPQDKAKVQLSELSTEKCC